MLIKKRLDLGKYQPYLITPEIGAWKWERPFPLQSDSGVLQIGFLGCGSAFSNLQFQSNLIFIKGKTAVFVDLGSKATLKMLELGLSVNDIKNLIITHSHADHIGSLEELLLKLRYEAPVLMALAEGYLPKDPMFMERVNAIKASGVTRPNLYVPYQYADKLWGESLKGGLAHSEATSEIGLGHMQPEEFFKLYPPHKVVKDKYGRDAWEFSIGESPDEIKFLMYVTRHVPDKVPTIEANFFSSGLIVDGRVMISGDTQFDADVFVGFAGDCETIFHDCQLFPGGVHAYYGDLCRLPKETKKKMFLYHCDDGMRKPLNSDGTLGGRDVTADGFAGFAEPIPTVYEFLRS